LKKRIEKANAGDYTAAPDRSFEFGLEAILDGIEGKLRKLRRKRRH
jgi:hypothetical protein